MTRPHTLAICAVGLVLATHGLDGQSLGQYRDFELGSTLASVASQTGVAPTQAKTIHQRPAVLQDLEWRPSQWIKGSAAPSTDPVEQMIFSFYDDRLFRIAVDYEHNRTEGMTDADMLAAISEVYGVPVKQTSGTVRMTSQFEALSGSPVARWRNANHTVVLYRVSSYRGEFRLVVTDAALDTLAQKATIQAVRLDDREAPQREVARMKKEQDETRAAAEKARIANKKVFRP
jgi:hypothetical protein